MRTLRTYGLSREPISFMCRRRAALDVRFIPALYCGVSK
jgi:hypothetical protein